MTLDSQTDKVYISEHTLAQHPIITNRLLKLLDADNVAYELLKHTKDGWCRDYMPIQTGRNRFIQYRYNPDYLDNDNDRIYITDTAEQLKALGITAVKTDIVMDGGNVIKCDGCVIMTEKVFKENPYHARNTLVDELERLFESEIVFIPWDKYDKYGHADGMVRYAGGGKVLMTNYYDFDKAMGERIYERLARRFEVAMLHYDAEKPHRHNWAYINFLQTSQIIAVPTFGREEDAQAMAQIGNCYPDYKGRIYPVRVNGLVKDGGALNCITWNIQT